MKSIERSDLYQTYATTKVKDIPNEYLDRLVAIILNDAGNNMGTEVPDKISESVSNMIGDSFKNLPLSYVASAIYKGSMGQYGAGRLVPRTIYAWLMEVTGEYERDRDHKTIQDRLAKNSTPVDLKKYPMGSAIIKKIEWLQAGAMTIDDWDKIDIKELAGMIGRGEHPVTSDFGIKR